MVETSGIVVFALWYIAIAYNYYMQNYFRVGMKARKCRCLMDVPSPTTPCSCSELSTLRGSCNNTQLKGSIKSGASGRDPIDILAEAVGVVDHVLDEELPPVEDNAGGDAEEIQDEQEPLDEQEPHDEQAPQDEQEPHDEQERYDEVVEEAADEE